MILELTRDANFLDFVSMARFILLDAKDQIFNLQETGQAVPFFQHTEG